MLENILIILLILISANFIYLFNRYRRKLKEALQYINNIILHITFVYEKMKMLDKKEMFQKDEELGILFISIKDLIDTLYKISTGENTDGEEKNK